MGNIIDVHETKEFSRILKKAGTVFNGVTLLVDDNLYKYSEDGDSVVNEFESNLTTEEWSALLTGAKLLRYEHVGGSFEEFEKTGFEYPVASKNFFSLTAQSIVYYNTLLLSKATLTYPVYYPTINGGLYIFTDSTDIDTFYAAWITAIETENINNLSVVRATITAVSDVDIDNARIDEVFAIEY